MSDITQMVETGIKKAYNSLSFHQKTALLRFSEEIPDILRRNPVLQWLYQNHWTDKGMDAVFYYMLWRIIDTCDNGEIFANYFPTKNWAYGDKEVDRNRVNLFSGHDRFDGNVWSYNQGHDGVIKLKKPMYFRAIDLGLQKKPSYIGSKDLEFRVEIGTTSLYKSYAYIMGLPGCFARMPYDIEGQEPGIVFFWRPKTRLEREERFKEFTLEANS
jgi:hypothetical protein